MDIWSTAVVAFLLLGRDQPFKRNGKVSVSASIKEEPDFSSLWGFSGSALRFLRSGLAKDPSRRPSAEEMLDNYWLCRPNLLSFKESERAEAEDEEE